MNVKPDPDPNPTRIPSLCVKTYGPFVPKPRQSHCGGGGSQGRQKGRATRGRKLERLMAGVWCLDGCAMLNGGTMIGGPALERPNEQGTVRVNIVVDGTGKVIQASPDYQSL